MKIFITFFEECPATVPFGRTSPDILAPEFFLRSGTGLASGFSAAEGTGLGFASVGWCKHDPSMDVIFEVVNILVSTL